MASPAQTPRRQAFGQAWLAIVVLIVAGVAVYGNALQAPFIFDDIPSIRDNPTLQELRRPGELLVPPSLHGAGAGGRPLVNLSLALNRALGGDNVLGYHVFNVLVHAAAGLVLFGFVRRTAERMQCEHDARGRELASGAAANSVVPVAFASALLWLVHPLQTESVTCIIQRTESLAGLFFLLTMYCFARAALTGGRSAAVWRGASWLACLLGAATKELLAVAPLLLLLYDRTFVTGTFRGALRRRGWFHGGVAVSTWWVVAALIWRSGGRGGTVGFGRGVSAWEYLLTQCDAVTMYLKLAVWPHPLVLDYGTPLVRDATGVAPAAMVLVALVAGTAWAIVRRPWLGFLGAWFFAILAPSSSVVPLVTQTMAEHRMYLPLAAVVVLAVVGAGRMLGRAATLVGVMAAIGFGSVTVARNADYRSAQAIWNDTVAKRPDNPRAHFTLAQLADDAGRHPEAIAHGQAAVRLLPADAAARFNLAFSLAKADRLDDAVAEYRAAARLRPESVDAHINLIGVLVRLGRLDDAITEGEWVVQRRPDSGQDQFNLAEVYRAAGRAADALPHYEEAVRRLPDSAAARQGLGNAHLKLAHYEEAVAAYREAVRLEPSLFAAQVNLAGALVRLGRAAEALPHYEAALRLQPGNASVAAALERARALAGQ